MIGMPVRLLIPYFPVFDETRRLEAVRLRQVRKGTEHLSIILELVSEQRPGAVNPASHMMFIALAKGDVAIDLPVIEVLRKTCLARAVGENYVLVPPAFIFVA